MEGNINETADVFIGNLPNDLSEEDLLETINFKDLTLRKFCQNGQKTFCFVHCGTHEKALNFVQKMEGFTIMGRKLIVKLQRDKSYESKKTKSHNAEYPFPRAIPNARPSDEESYGHPTRSSFSKPPANHQSHNNGFTNEPVPSKDFDSEDDLPPLNPVVCSDHSYENEVHPMRPTSRNSSIPDLRDPVPLLSCSHRERNGLCHSAHSSGALSPPATCEACCNHHDIHSKHDCCSKHTDLSHSRHPGSFTLPSEQGCAKPRGQEMFHQHCDAYGQSGRCMSEYAHKQKCNHSQHHNHRHEQPDLSTQPNRCGHYTDEYVHQSNSEGLWRNERGQKTSGRQAWCNREHVRPPNESVYRSGDVRAQRSIKHTQKSNDKYAHQPLPEYEYQRDRYGQQSDNRYGRQSYDNWKKPHNRYVQSGDRYHRQSNNRYSQRSYAANGNDSGLDYAPPLPPPQNDFSYRTNRGCLNNHRRQSDSRHKFHDGDDAFETQVPIRRNIHHQRFPRQQGTFRPKKQYMQQPCTSLKDTSYQSRGYRFQRQVVLSEQPVSREVVFEEEEVELEDEEPFVLLVTNFPYGTTEEMIYDLFADFGPTDVQIMCNSPDPDFYCTEAYVCIPSEELASSAILNLDKTLYKHRTLHVSDVSDEELVEELEAIHV